MREHCFDQVRFSRDSGQKWITGERMSSEMDISVTNDYLNIVSLHCKHCCHSYNKMMNIRQIDYGHICVNQGMAVRLVKTATFS